MKRPPLPHWPLALCLLLVVLACAGCVSGPRSSVFAFAPYRSMGVPHPDKALVYFYRDNSLICGANYYIHDGFDRIGGLPCKAYFYEHLEPGHHLFWGEAYMRGEQSITLKAGKTYYIRVDTQINDFGLVIRPLFTVVSERMGRDAVLASRMVSLR